MHLPVDPLLLADGLEALMLISFGLAWPLNSLSMLRNRRAEGKSLTFTVMVLCGYLAGATGKMVAAVNMGVAPSPILWLYLVNCVSIGVNAWLYCHFRTAGRRPAGLAPD
jgi:lipopolysaccharide export LptBFGC system permease protein LptF